MTDVFASLAEKLEGTGLYKVSGDNFVGAELAAYAEGLRMYYDELDDLLKECFALTAEEYGLQVYEKMLSVCNSDTSLEGRRNSIVSARSLSSSVLTEQLFKKLLGIFNIDGSFTQESGTIRYTSSKQIEDTKKKVIEQQIQNLMPLGTNFEFT